MLKRNLSLVVKTALLWLFLCLAVGVPIVISAPNADVDLAITKTDSVDPVVAGEPLSYLLSISNAGPSTATGVVITDSLPSGVTYASASNGCVYNTGNRTVRCDMSDVGAGSVSSATIQVLVDPATTGLLLNNAIVSTLDTDTNASNNTAQATTTITPSVPTDSADLQITKHDLRDPIRAGELLTYTITISNTGPATATGVIVTDTLPVSAALSSISTSQGSCTELICNLGTISASSGALITMTVNVYPSVTGVITNTAEVSANEADPVAGNNLTHETTTILQAAADLQVTKHDLTDPVRAGEGVTYTISVTNAGPGMASGVMVTDTLPTSVTFQSVTTSQGNCVLARCNLGTLAAAGTATITMTASVNPSATGVITNSVTASANQFDPVIGNNSAQERTSIVRAADLSVQKTGTPEPVFAGRNLAYRLQIRNHGPSRAEGVHVVDNLPAAVSFLSAPPGCVHSSGSVDCSLGSMQPGASVVVTVTVQVSPAATGLVANIASLSSSTSDPVPANNQSEWGTNILPPDNQKPTVSWQLPVLNGQRLNVMCQVMRLQVSATDNLAVHHVRFFRWDPYYGPLGGYIEIGIDTSAPYQWDLNTCNLNPNWNQIFAEAQDTYGNLDWTSQLERKYIWLFRNMVFLPVVSR